MVVVCATHPQGDSYRNHVLKEYFPVDYMLPNGVEELATGVWVLNGTSTLDFLIHLGDFFSQYGVEFKVRGEA
ncbi:hypothetical protein [Photobacterium ganghwense]|uniref:hypothetical protein n=1 Tax=Photobacterium ganghwense TaxID=320778 RepID=UPI001C2D007F|nr:hypothetical protein [Photobacterium ganghwense]MBV1842920.1 hypothetical protein [Photobacterium ganghwense]